MLKTKPQITSELQQITGNQEFWIIDNSDFHMYQILYSWFNHDWLKEIYTRPRKKNL
jgi:hypothetical protein